MADMTYAETVKLFQDSGYDLVEMVDGPKRVAICPNMGGRVVAMSLWHEEGVNPFWINPVDVQSGPGSEKLIFRGGLGGRDWLGPEGCGDMSFYFKQGPLVFDNWYVDDRQSLPKMSVKRQDAGQVVTSGEIHIPNLRGNMFDILMEQQMTFKSSQESLGVAVPRDALYVGFERETSFKNIGQSGWGELYGYCMIWFLLMLRASEKMFVLVPFKDGDGPEVIDYEFNDGPIPADRLMVRKDKGYVLFKGDGRERGKIGQIPSRAGGVVYGVDLVRGNLTVLKYDVDETTPYLDNRWTEEAISSGGDVMDTYNNQYDNEVLPGTFCELEAVSSRLGLGVGEQASLRTVTGFYHGGLDMMQEVIKATSGCDISGETFA